jgi:anthraniloyl-CoA monooxygenase
MRIVCVGGGPAGLYFALLIKRADPQHEVTVIERNRPYDTFGWGVVFSDQTLGNLEAADQDSHQKILENFNRWDDIHVHFRGRIIRSGGHGFSAIGRKRLVNILQKRCEELGVQLVFQTELGPNVEFTDADLVIGADGMNSRVRDRFAHVFQPQVELGNCRFVWLGTHKLFEAFTFAFEETEYGWFQAYAYRYDRDTSAFIIETPELVWTRAGLDKMEDDAAIAFCEKLFAKQLDGYGLMSNSAHLRGSAMWSRFPRVVCAEWVYWRTNWGRRTPVVLIGDAAHTAHFSIGSGTKAALEDAIALSRAIAAQSDLVAALEVYQQERRAEVLKIQSAARNSSDWFEHVGRYAAMEPEQFTYSLLTRSQRISHERLRLRDKGYVRDIESFIAAQSGLAPEPRPPMFTPFKVRGLTLKNRVVVSPMAMYSCSDGTPDDFYLVHLGSRAHGGAAMVFTEMTCVTAEGRISPGCAGMYKTKHKLGWQWIVNYIHGRTSAKVAIQLGHSGPKGSTQIGWEQADEPLAADNWPLLAASAVPYGPNNQTPTAMTRADMDEVTAAFVRAAEWANECGFDWLELDCAHGYLLSSFICPLTNQRNDKYGGRLETRCRYPLEVFAAIRAVWPKTKPMSVQISAHDWAPGGNTPDDAVVIARMFRDAGSDVIDVSSGQTTRLAQPVYGQMYQTPFADRIRQEAGIATMAVGAIYEPDHVNSIIASGRADLCAIARAHLADPYWTLHAAAQLNYPDFEWPPQYLSGKAQLERNLARAAPMPNLPDNHE